MILMLAYLVIRQRASFSAICWRRFLHGNMIGGSAVPVGELSVFKMDANAWHQDDSNIFYKSVS